MTQLVSAATSTARLAMQRSPPPAALPNLSLAFRKPSSNFPPMSTKRKLDKDPNHIHVGSVTKSSSLWPKRNRFLDNGFNRRHVEYSIPFSSLQLSFRCRVNPRHYGDQWSSSHNLQFNPCRRPERCNARGLMEWWLVSGRDVPPKGVWIGWINLQR
jgi:hypothetical protein